MAYNVEFPLPSFRDIDGSPLENGYIWIGTAGLDAQTNPINAYWDAAATQLITQPIRTIGGYPSNNGVRSRVYVTATDYSIKVTNVNGSEVIPAALYNPKGTTASVIDYGADPAASGATNRAAFEAALAAHDTVRVPAGTYSLTGLTMLSNKSLVGDGEDTVLNCSGTINFTDCRRGGLRSMRVNLTSASATLVRLQKGAGVGSFELYFEDVNFVGDINNAATVGLHITDSYINSFVNCLFIDFDKCIIHGTEANRNNYFGCSIRARLTYGTSLVEQTAGHANSFTGCDLENCARMLDLQGGSIFFGEGCYFEAHNNAFGFQLTGGHVGFKSCYFNEVFLRLASGGSLEMSHNYIKGTTNSTTTFPIIRTISGFSRLILNTNILEGTTYLLRADPTLYNYMQLYDEGGASWGTAYPSAGQVIAINDSVYDVTAAAIRQCELNNVRAYRSRSAYYSEGRVRLDGESTGVQLVSSAWDYNPLRLGDYYLWVDATGDLRIKNGAPANDVDGTIVGTQS